MGVNQMSRKLVSVQVVPYRTIPDPIMGDYQEQCRVGDEDIFVLYLVTADGDKHTVGEFDTLEGARLMGLDLRASMGVPLEVIGQ